MSSPTMGDTLNYLYYEFIPSKTGKRLYILVNKHTFSQINKDVRYWYCTDKLIHSCGVKLRLNEKKAIIKKFSCLEHNHEPPKLFKTPNVTAVTLSTGNTFLIIDGHTFRKEVCVNGATSRWCCNEPSRGKCDVYAHVNDKFELVLIVNKHNHEPILCRLLQGRII